MSELVTKDQIRVPRGTGNGFVEIDLSRVRELEARKEEASAISKVKAPELLTAMNEGYTILATKLLPLVSYELTQAKQAADERKAVVFLDEAPRILKEKGLSRPNNPSGSADQREAILSLDPEFKKLRNAVDMLDAVYELLKGKMRGFEMSYSSVKRTYDDLSGYGKTNYGRSTSVPVLQDEVTAGDDVDQYGNLKIGVPRY